MDSAGLGILLSSITLVVIVLVLHFKFPTTRRSKSWAHDVALCATASLPLWVYVFYIVNFSQINSTVTEFVGESYSAIALFLVFYFSTLLLAVLFGISAWWCTYQLAEGYQSRTKI
mgnify:CR=1 FL=1